MTGDSAGHRTMGEVGVDSVSMTRGRFSLSCLIRATGHTGWKGLEIPSPGEDTYIHAGLLSVGICHRLRCVRKT